LPKALAYHRPATITDAIGLLAEPGRTVLGGGTVLNTPGGIPVEVVDLQALNLDKIVVEGDRIRCGAMTTLQQVVEGPVPELVARAARRELPMTLRNQATLGGVVAGGDWESVLLATLLVSDASVELTGSDGSEMHLLSALLRTGVEPGRIITSITFETDGNGIIESTGRTPADTPIVAAVGRRSGDEVLIALTGVAATPILVEPTKVDRLQPPGDFRGSSDYRLHLARVLTRRVVEGLP